MNKRYLVNLLLSTPFDWSADYGRQTAYRLAKKHEVWCLVWHNTQSLKELLVGRHRLQLLEQVQPSIFVYTAVHWLPGKRWQVIVAINKILNVWVFRGLRFWKSLGKRFHKRIHWIFDPGLVDLLVYFGDGLVVYDSVDFFAGALHGKARKQFELNEKQLITSADLAFGNSHFLYERIRKYRKDVVMVPQGFDRRAFVKSQSKKPLFNRTNKPIVGYVGGINERLDYDMLFDLIARHPQWEFVFWGPHQYTDENSVLARQVEKLMSYPNVRMGGGPREELPGVLKSFAVGLIPYTKTDFNTYCHPMKIFEYFYFGIPTVASRIYELTFPEYTDFVRIADTTNEWEEGINFFVKQPLTEKQRKTQLTFANEQTWEIKIAKILSHIDEK